MLGMRLRGRMSWGMSFRIKAEEEGRGRRCIKMVEELGEKGEGGEGKKGGVGRVGQEEGDVRGLREDGLSRRF